MLWRGGQKKPNSYQFNMVKHSGEFDAADPRSQTTDIEEARQSGIMPISYMAK